MPTSNVKYSALVSAVAATAQGTQFQCPNQREHTFTVISTAVTSGATIVLQMVDFGNNTCTLQTISSTANASNAYTFAGCFQAVNAKVSAYTDGVHTVNYAGSIGLYSQ